MNIPQTGVNEQKVKFFKDVANAFEFLSVFYSLRQEEQLELMRYITELQARRQS